MDDTTENRMRLVKTIQGLTRTVHVDVSMDVDELRDILETYHKRQTILKNKRSSFRSREFEIREFTATVTSLKGQSVGCIDDEFAFDVCLFEFDHALAELQLRGQTFPWRRPENVTEVLACLKWMDGRIAFSKHLAGIVYEPVWLKAYRRSSLRSVFPSVFNPTSLMSPDGQSLSDLSSPDSTVSPNNMRSTADPKLVQRLRGYIHVRFYETSL
jgi:hypothetical protein